MPTFRCEYDVTSDLVLPKDIGELKLGSLGGYAFTLRNAPPDKEGHATGLHVTVIGPSESIDSAQEDLREALAEQLDLLTFCTHSRLKIVAPLRLVEWEAGKKKLKFKAFHTSDARYPPDPELVGDYIATVETLDRASVPDSTRVALRYFRYGLLDHTPEDQFMRLWLSLEIVAENLKDKTNAPITCPVCGVALKCHQCGCEPTRIPMAKQEIVHLITKIVGDRAPEVSKRQFKARNGLMHGRTRESIEKECKVPMHTIVNELGTIAWHAIMSTIALGDGPQLTFGHRGGEFAGTSLLMSIVGEFEHAGTEPYPPEDKIPNAEISMRTKFRPE